MSKTKKYLNTGRNGFAVSFELMATMSLVLVLIFITTYFCEVMQTRRFFADVASSTCAIASRYGGNDSIAYKVQAQKYNTSGRVPLTIEDNANTMLTTLSGRNLHGDTEFIFQPQENNKFISVSNVNSDTNEVTVTMNYTLGNYGWGGIAQRLGMEGQTTHYRVTLPSLMQSGKLIDAK